MSDWSDLMNDVSDACDAAFADEEGFEFRPMRQLTVNDPVSADPDRSVVDVVAIFSALATDYDFGQRRPATARSLGGDAIGRASVGLPRVGIDLRQLPEGCRKLDRIKRKKTGDVYSIEDFQPDGQGRAVLPLAFVNREVG